MKWSIVILMVLFLACVIWSHGGFDNLSLDNNIVLTYGYNLYVDCYNFCIDIINEVG